MHTQLFSHAEGFPSSGANNVAIGPDGRVWVASFVGLFRFDGSTFERVRDFDHRSLSGGYRQVCVDRDTHVWSGGAQVGLFVFRADGEQREVLRPDGRQFSGDGAQVLPARDGGVWTYAVEGLYHARPEGEARLVYPLVSRVTGFQRMAEDGAGRLWTEHNLGLLRSSGTGREAERKRPFQDTAIRVRDRAVVYATTDGLPDQLDAAGQRFATAGFRAVTQRRDTPEDFARRLAEVVDGLLAGAEQMDDISVLRLDLAAGVGAAVDKENRLGYE